MSEVIVGYAKVRIGRYGGLCSVYIAEVSDDRVTLSWPNQVCLTYDRSKVLVVSQTEQDKLDFNEIAGVCK